MSTNVEIAGVVARLRRWTPGDGVISSRMIAIDTETHLIDDTRPSEYPPSVVMTVYGGGDVVDLVMWQDIDEYLEGLFKADRDTVYVFHNAPFDIGVTGFRKWESRVEGGQIYDTGLQWVLRRLATRGLGDDEREYPSLARVCRDVLGIELEKDGEVRLTFRRGVAVDEPHAVYACKDAMVTWKCCMLMGPQETMDTQVKGFMMLDAIRRNGMLVDRDRMTALRQKYLLEMEAHKGTLRAWGIRLDKSKTPTEMLTLVMTGWLGMEETNGRPEERVWLLKRVLLSLLEGQRLDPEWGRGLQAGWTNKVEKETKELLDATTSRTTELIPPVRELSKRQTIRLLWWAATNLSEGRDPRTGMDEYWTDNEGWPSGYTEKGSETVMQGLLEEAIRVHGLDLPRTEKGKVALNDEALEEVPPESLAKLPFLDSWKGYKHAEKLCSTFLNEKNIGADGRVHPRPTPILATGRTSMSPNLQNVSKEPGIREQYMATPGYVLCSCDYNQQELVALAQICYTTYGFSRLRDLINSGIDVHGYMGATIGGVLDGFPEFNVENAEIVKKYKDAIADYKHTQPSKYKELRQLSKALNFGYPGGLGASRFITYARGYGVTISEEESFELKALWLRTFPEMPLHLKPEPMNDSRFGDRYKAVTLTGRLRVNCSFCAACNSVFQGLAADCSKLAGWRLLKEGYRLVNFVHDEYIAELPLDEHLTARAKYMAQVMIEEMQKITPDVRVSSTPALMFRWSKAAEDWYDGDGDLTPWELVPKGREEDGSSGPIPWENLDEETRAGVIEKKHRLRELCRP